MRVHAPLLLALSANSPFWRGDNTGLDSTRTPVFRAFPRVGIPPRYDNFADWERRIEFMMQSKVIGDYTYLWYDVRPHPNFGTVEVRVMDSQTRVEHTLALAALVQAMVKELCEHYASGEELGSEADFDCLEEILDRGNGASRQQVVYQANHDLREVVREILDATVPEAAEATGE
jgi:carboxylate-amine ligase